MTRSDGRSRRAAEWAALALTACLLAPAAVRAAGEEGGAGAEDVVERARKNRRALVKSLIAAPEEEPRRADLEATILRLRSIRMRPKSEIPPRPTSPSGSGEARGTGADAQAAAPPSKPPKRTPTVSQEQLDRLRNLPAERIADPVALADALLKAGYDDEAYLFYEQALEADPPDETKAWLLFRTARSRAESDPGAAVQLYRRLIAEHPESPWSAVARSLAGLLEWYHTARPVEATQVVTSTATAPTSERPTR